jgi:hypothetical protein
VQRKRFFVLTGALGFACSAVAAPQLDDYAQGISVAPLSDRPLIEVHLPDAVYQSVTQPDLADVRVFNAEGAAVPHALCASPSEAEPSISHVELPVFDLQTGAHRATNDARIEVNTASGAEVRIEESQSGAQALGETHTAAHVIDARTIEDQLRAIQFEWRSPDGASEARILIDASEDLDRWHTVVPTSALLQITQNAQQLRRERIPLPQQRYRYLRVARIDAGPPLHITSVIAERVAAPETIEPVWFTATLLESTTPNEFLFDGARLAPISYARLRLLQDNTSVRLSIDSRKHPHDPWRHRWSGEMYAIVNKAERRVSPPAQFDRDYDRYWRVRYAAPTPTPPTLELGYRPAQLRFLAQGAAPFTVAFGSRRAGPASAQQCNALIADASASDLQRLIAQGTVGPPRTLAGAVALQPLPKQTPLRLILLWAVLVAGVALLIGMALSLLKRVRSE